MDNFDIKKEIESALEIRPHDRALKKLFFEIIGFDRKMDALRTDSFSPHVQRTISTIHVFGQISEFRLFLVRLKIERITLWSNFNRALSDIFREYSDSLIIITGSKDGRWYLAQERNGKPVLIENFIKSKRELDLLVSIALKAERIKGTLDLSEAISGSFEEVRSEKETKAAKEGLRKAARFNKAITVFPTTEEEWLHKMACYPKLDDESENKLLQTLRKHWPFPRYNQIPESKQLGTQDLYEQLVFHNYWLVWAIVKKYDWQLEKFDSFDMCDLLQEGAEGLLEAIRSYEPSGCRAFRTLVNSCVKKRIDAFINKNRYY